ncbi:MAG TPA: class I SAM-dependent methyltransferase, partial [Candidatus Udaeobacter sp.]|nr:class I SAM-dependent methyltransferase [Candidatus Udaeobacter sp.]
MTAAPTEAWGSGDAYERYVGRWSRKVAAELLRWLAPAPGLAWADVGSGTGALAETILAACAPAAIEGVDASAGFVAAAQQRLRDPRVRFITGDATRLPWEAGAFDVAVS